MKKSVKSKFAVNKIVFKSLVLSLALISVMAAVKNVSGKNLRQPSSILLNTISGTVFDARRQPVSDIYVELQDELNRSVSRMRTNGAGRYSFTGMRAGRYFIKVIVSQGDYEPQTVEVEVVNLGGVNTSTGASFGSSDNVQQDIYLRQRRSASNNKVNAVIFAQEIPKDAQSDYEKAVSLLEQQKKDAAIKLLKQAIEKFPAYYLALNALGYEYFTQEDFVKASELLARAADVYPSEPTVYLLAYSLFLGKNYEVVIQVLKNAVKLHESSARLYTILGGSLRLNKQFHEAEEAIIKAQSLDNDYPEAHWQMALLYGNNLNKFGEAADHLETFLKLQPNTKDKESIKKLITQFRNKDKSKQ